MADFRPEAVLAALHREGVRYVVIGGLAAALHGADHVTTDIDITPATDRANLERLAKALRDLTPKIRAVEVPGGVEFDCSAEFFARVQVANLTTSAGDVDIAVVPAGTQGYDDLQRDAITITLDGIPVAVASLADIVRSKEAAGRPKDELVLPTLRRILEERGDLGSER